MVFNNISVISWRSVLLVEETRVPWENHWPAASHWQTLLHNVVKSVPCLSEIQTHSVSGDRHWLHTITATDKFSLSSRVTYLGIPAWYHDACLKVSSCIWLLSNPIKASSLKYTKRLYINKVFPSSTSHILIRFN